MQDKYKRRVATGRGVAKKVKKNNAGKMDREPIMYDGWAPGVTFRVENGWWYAELPVPRLNPPGPEDFFDVIMHEADGTPIVHCQGCIPGDLYGVVPR
eukprot:evm.model.scf_113.7 EVM.evm.TU.scf_113.7   scf_113:107348-107896(-)